MSMEDTLNIYTNKIIFKDTTKYLPYKYIFKYIKYKMISFDTQMKYYLCFIFLGWAVENIEGIFNLDLLYLSIAFIQGCSAEIRLHSTFPSDPNRILVTSLTLFDIFYVSAPLNFSFSKQMLHQSNLSERFTWTVWTNLEFVKKGLCKPEWQAVWLHMPFLWNLMHDGNGVERLNIWSAACQKDNDGDNGGGLALEGGKQRFPECLLAF